MKKDAIKFLNLMFVLWKHWHAERKKPGYPNQYEIHKYILGLIKKEKENV